MNSINLVNLGGGAAVERFDEELSKVIENIVDPNTEAQAKREIIVKIAIKPNKERRFGEVQVFASSKLAPVVAFETRAYFGRDGENFVACEDNPSQLTIDDFMKPAENVKEIGQETKRAEVGK